MQPRYTNPAFRGPVVRVGGVEAHGKQFRVRLFAANGTSTHGVWPEAGEAYARAFVHAYRTQAGRSLGSAVEEYLDHLARFGGARRRPVQTVKTRRSMLEGMLQLRDPEARKANRGKRVPTAIPMTDRPLSDLTPSLAQRLYNARVAGVTSAGKPISADTHHSELVYANAFGRWCEEHGYLPHNPFANVLPEGEKSAGKEQLNIDQAREFVRHVYADDHPLLGVAAAGILTLGLRANELLDRRVADLVDDGKSLLVKFGKSEASKRSVAVPPVLRSELKRLCVGQAPGAYIFGSTTDGTLLKYVQKVCRNSGLPVVCTHALRGTQITLTVKVNDVVAAASSQAGHAGTGVTRRHYLAAGVEQSARARLMEEILFIDASADRERQLAEAEAEARDAAEKLARLRAAAESLRVGTPLTPPSPTSAN